MHLCSIISHLGRLLFIFLRHLLSFSRRWTTRRYRMNFEWIIAVFVSVSCNAVASLRTPVDLISCFLIFFFVWLLIFFYFIFLIHRTQAITLAKTCESTTEMRECRSPRDWSLLALQNTRTGKSHYLVICRCPDNFNLGKICRFAISPRRCRLSFASNGWMWAECE